MLVYVQVTLHLPDKPAHVAKWLIFHFTKIRSCLLLQKPEDLTAVLTWTLFAEVKTSAPRPSFSQGVADS